MKDFAFEKSGWNMELYHPNHGSWDDVPKLSNGPTPLPWHVGDPKKRRLILQQFSQTTSLHGVQHLCPRRKTASIITISYRIIFVCCFLLTIFNVAYVLEEAFGKESTYINSINKDMDTGPVDDPVHFPRYPTVTVCRKPPFRTDFNSSYKELVEYIFLALGYPFVSITPRELAFVVDLARNANDTLTLDNETSAFGDHLSVLHKKYQNLKSERSFNLRSFITDHSVQCHEFFRGCFVMVFPMNCCAIFQPVLTTMGMCYTMEENDELIHETGLVDIPFIMDLNTPDSPGKEVEMGFNVFLTDPLDTVSSFLQTEGEKIVPGFITTISVQLVKRQSTALHTAWHGMSTNCPSMPGPVNTKRYTHKMCDLYLETWNLRRFCKCRSVVERGFGFQRICDPFDMYYCIVSYSMSNNLSDHRQKCREPCIDYKYRNKVSYMGLGTADISRVQIVYNAKQYYYLEYRTWSFSSLFSQIGGCLGLYLGASIITLVEILTFVSSWLWFRIRPSKLKTKTKNSPHIHGREAWSLA